MARNVGINVRTIGLENVLRNMTILERDITKVVGETLFQESEKVMTEIKTIPIVPVDTGVLRATGHVELPERTATGINVELGFGGPAVIYAAVQHERLDYHHPVGQAKYLEGPVRNNIRNFTARIIRALRKFIRRFPER